MSYNSKDYIKVRNEFENKYLAARASAEAKTAEVHMLIPDIFEIDRVLSHTGLDIMAIISSGVKDTDAEIAKLEARNNELIARREKLLTAYGLDKNHTDIHYECEKCADTGFIDTKMCDCMRQALVRAGYESSGLGRLIGKQTFDNFDISYYDNRETVKVYCAKLREFAENFAENKENNYLFIGTTGLGKTHLSTAIAQKVIESGHDVLYVSAITLMGDFEKNRFGSQSTSPTSNDLSRYYSADLLIIDDLGTEVVNKFTQSCMYEIINTRINTSKSTIISTNYIPSELSAIYTDRISSRLLGEYQPLLFKGKDIRTQKRI